VPDQEVDQRGHGETREVVRKDCQASKLNRENDRNIWRKLIKIGVSE